MTVWVNVDDHPAGNMLKRDLDELIGCTRVSGLLMRGAEKKNVPSGDADRCHVANALKNCTKTGARPAPARRTREESGT